MSSTRYVLGGLAVVGGVYYYDQNVSPIIPRKTVKHETERFDKFASQQASKLGDKVSNVMDDAKHELNHHKDKIDKQWKNMAPVDDAKAAVIDYSKDVRDAAQDQLPAQNAFVRTVDKYIDLVNEAAGTKTTQFLSMSRDVEIKPSAWDRFFHRTPETVEDKLQKLDKHAQETTNGLFSWGSKKASEAKSEADRLALEAEKQKKSWFSWGSKKSKEVSDAANDANKAAQDSIGQFKLNAAKTKDDIVSWSSQKLNEIQGTLVNAKDNLQATLDKEKTKARETFDVAKAHLDDLLARFGEAAEPSKQRELEKAKSDFRSAFDHLKLYGEDVVSDVSSTFKKN